MNGESVIDVDFAQQAKHSQLISGDVFLSRRVKEEGRVICVLSDGLGSGVKASVLANLTATMAIKYTESFVDVRQSARTIMDTLPICEVRKISYSTFTIVDTDADGNTRIIEHGNPDAIVLRGDREHRLAKSTFTLEEWKDRVIGYAEFKAQLGDRIILCSDGISQSGLGTPGMPLGWRRDSAVRLAQSIISRQPDIASLRLARNLVAEALSNDRNAAKDDITCGVIHLRRPRKLLVITGPPFSRERDAELGEMARGYAGRTAVCGGTTAGIIARVLDREIAVNLDQLDPQIPPASKMEGIDLVTEGTLTLARVAEMLENGRVLTPPVANAAHTLLALMLESDIVDFVVGTRINEAHQDPNVPVELDLRRNIIRRIVAALETRHLKQTTLRFV